MTIAEQRKVLGKLAHSKFWADMMCMDAVCYGGDVEGYRDQREYAKKVIDAFPKDIIDAYNAELRKAEADKLRARADEIERRKEGQKTWSR
jgi:hypothetical protein